MKLYIPKEEDYFKSYSKELEKYIERLEHENERIYIKLDEKDKEIERLHNIIKELEKELDLNLPFKVVGVRHLKNKLQELKGEDKDLKPRIRRTKKEIEADKLIKKIEVEVEETGGVSFTDLLGVAFVALKLSNNINWSWVWVLAPWWIMAILYVLEIIVKKINGDVKE